MKVYEVSSIYAVRGRASGGSHVGIVGVFSSLEKAHASSPGNWRPERKNDVGVISSREITPEDGFPEGAYGFYQIHEFTLDVPWTCPVHNAEPVASAAM